jgi:hypothetical protein
LFLLIARLESPRFIAADSPRLIAASETIGKVG